MPEIDLKWFWDIQTIALAVTDTQGSYALFRTWKIYCEISIFVYNGNYGVSILYNNVFFDTGNRFQVFLEQLEYHLNKYSHAHVICVT